MSQDLQKIENILNDLNEEQLISLNRKVVERLKMFSRAKQLGAMSKFNLYDRAYFMHDGEMISGTIVKLNQKTVGFKSDDGVQWKVAPSLLSKIIEY